MRTVNRVLRRFGFVALPLPPTAKMLREHANVLETARPYVHGSFTLRWLRHVADLVDGD
jgi:tRNA G10  N-methylase Trm11